MPTLYKDMLLLSWIKEVYNAINYCSILTMLYSNVMSARVILINQQRRHGIFISQRLLVHFSSILNMGRGGRGGSCPKLKAPVPCWEILPSAQARWVNLSTHPLIQRSWRSQVSLRSFPLLPPITLSSPGSQGPGRWPGPLSKASGEDSGTMG